MSSKLSLCVRFKDYTVCLEKDKETHKGCLMIKYSILVIKDVLEFSNNFVSIMATIMF